MPRDMEPFVAPEGLRTVATGEAASGTTDDAKPVVEVGFPYLIAPEERRILECHECSRQLLPPPLSSSERCRIHWFLRRPTGDSSAPPRQICDYTTSSTGYAALHP